MCIGKQVSGSLFPLPGHSARHPDSSGSRAWNYPEWHDQIKWIVQTGLTCAGRARGRGGCLWEPVLPGKRSGTAAFPSICAVTPVVWKEEGGAVCVCRLVPGSRCSVCMHSCAAGRTL